MFRCLNRTNKANVKIELVADKAVVSYTINPRHAQPAEKHFQLHHEDVAKSIVDLLKKEVIPDDTYHLTIVVNSSKRKDSTECKDLTSRKVLETFESFIPTHLNQQLSQHEVKTEPKFCAIL